MERVKGHKAMKTTDKIYEERNSILLEKLAEIERMQHDLMMTIIKDEDGVGGLLGGVRGENGTFAVESIYLEHRPESLEPQVMCHLDYPSFEGDACFDDFSVTERQQIIQLAIETVKTYHTP